MTARRVYEADRAVLEECARRGVTDLTARKLERWRRHLPDRAVEHRRGQRGSHTSNPPHYVDHVLALDAILKAGRPLRHAPAYLFGRGFPVKINDLRHAYADLYTHLRHDLTMNVAHTDEEPADRADKLAGLHTAGIQRSATGRRWTKRAKRLAGRGGARQADDPNALFAGALSAMLTSLVAGEQPSTEGVAEALSITGLNDGQDPEAAGARLATFHLDAICTAIDQATEAEWLAARDNLESLAHYIELRRIVEKLGLPDETRLDGLTDLDLNDPDVRSVLIPVALVFDKTWRPHLNDQSNQFMTVGKVLAGMPENIRLLFQDYATRDENDPAGIPVELQTFLLTWAQTHPDDAAQFSVVLPTQ